MAFNPKTVLPEPSASSFKTPNFLYCNSCKVSVNSNAEWLTHLVGEGHQIAKRLNGRGTNLDMANWDQRCTLKVSEIAGIPAQKVAEAINVWGPVEDISYLARKDGGTHQCHFLMRTPESVLSITRTTQPIKIGARTIDVRQWIPGIKAAHSKALSTSTLANWERNSHRSGGIQSNGKFFCKSCSVTIFPLAGWITHLTCEGHQSRHRECRFARKIFWDLERTIRIGDILHVPPQEVINYVLEFGPIEDFFYVPTKKQTFAPLCYCLFSCLASMEKITENSKHTALTKKGNRLSLTVSTINPDLKLRYKKMAEMYGAQKRRGASAEALVLALKTELDLSRENEEDFYVSDEHSARNETNGSGMTHRNIPVDNSANEPTRLRKHAFDCVSCDVECRNNEEWWEHLASMGHRRVKNSLPGGGLKFFNHTESVMLGGLVGVERMDILRYSGSWGPVVDFLYQPEKDGVADNCYVHFDSPVTVENLLHSSGALVIGSTQVKATAVAEYAGWSKKQKKALMAEKRALEVAAEVKAKVESKSFQEEASEVIQLMEGKSLSQQIEELVEYIKWDDNFLEKCKEVVEEDLPFVIKKDKNARLLQSISTLLPFGQYSTGVSFKKNPTIHLLVDAKVGSVQDTILLLHELRKALERCKPSANLCPAQVSVNSISPPEDSFPFGSELHFKNLAMKNDVVMRLASRLVVQESALIHFYTKLDPRIKPVLSILAYLNELFKLAKFTPKDEAFPDQIIHFLVLFFLTHKKIVPTVDHLYQQQKMCNSDTKKEEPDLEGYSISFCQDLNVVTPNTAVMEMLSDPAIRALSCLGLLKDIMEFYGSVDLDKFVLCLRFGTLVPKADFLPENVGKLPGDLGRMYRFSSNGSHRSEFLDVGSLLVLQDPFVLHLNLTKLRGSKKNLYRFIRFCRASTKRLETEMTTETPNIGTIFKSKWQSFATEYPNDGDGGSEAPSREEADESEVASINPPKKIKLDADVQHCGPTNSKLATTSEATTSGTPEIMEPASLSLAEAEVDTTTVEQEVKKESEVVEISDQEDDGWDKPESPTIFDRQDEYENVDDYEDNKDRNVDLTTAGPDLEGVEDFDDDISVISVEEDGVDLKETSRIVEDTTAEMTLNRSLQVYFKRNFQGPDTSKVIKLQALLLQYAIEFNSLFWSRCFNLAIEMKGDYANWTLPRFAAVDGLEGLYTLEERLASVDLSFDTVDLRFTVKSSRPKIHSFLEIRNLELVSWKALKAGGANTTLSDLTKLLIDDHEDSAAALRASSFVPLTSENYLEIDGHLKAAIVRLPGSQVSLGRCVMIAKNPQVAPRKVDFITKMWKRLEAKYCDRMVKKWLSSCKDFDRTKADNFQDSVAKGFQQKAKKKQKNLQKFLNKRSTSMQGRVTNYAPSTNSNLIPVGPRGILKNPTQRFPSPQTSSSDYSQTSCSTPGYPRPHYGEQMPSAPSRAASWRAPGSFMPRRPTVSQSYRFREVTPSRYANPRNSFQSPQPPRYDSYSTTNDSSSGYQGNSFNSFEQYRPRIPGYQEPGMFNQPPGSQQNSASFRPTQRQSYAYPPPPPDSDRVPIYRRF